LAWTAVSTRSLGVVAPDDGTLESPAMQVTADLFQASITLRVPGGTVQRWSIRQDALVWSDTPPVGSTR
jgi:hypothetical protein